MKKNILQIILWIALMVTGCSKDKNSPGTTTNTGGESGGINGSKDTSCVITAISQVNSGKGAEFSLTANYNDNYQLSGLACYDSVNKIKTFEAEFNYININSVRLNNYQYLFLDADKRVVFFSTLADLSDPDHSDQYVFKYKYNTNGYLSEKKLYINNSKTANFSSTYTYTGNLLTNCIMTASSSGNQKVLESTLSYYNTPVIKNWIYTFPDAMEEYPCLVLFNFGNHSLNPLKGIITKVYDPATGKLLDTWTTTYSNYTIDPNGYVLSGEADGDMQQGFPEFYGKTNFYYSCH